MLGDRRGSPSPHLLVIHIKGCFVKLPFMILYNIRAGDNICCGASLITQMQGEEVPCTALHIVYPQSHVYRAHVCPPRFSLCVTHTVCILLPLPPNLTPSISFVSPLSFVSLLLQITSFPLPHFLQFSN